MRSAIGMLWLMLASGLCGQDSLAAKYPGDAGIEFDPDVLFADNFESGNLDRWDERKGEFATLNWPTSIL